MSDALMPGFDSTVRTPAHGPRALLMEIGTQPPTIRSIAVNLPAKLNPSPSHTNTSNRRLSSCEQFYQTGKPGMLFDVLSVHGTSGDLAADAVRERASCAESISKSRATVHSLR